MNKNAIYPGSFDPFTNGHLDVVRKAADIFDNVYVLLGTNPAKRRAYLAEEMRGAVERSLHDDGITNCQVLVHDGLTAVFAKEHGIRYMVRGLRNSTDYSYEENSALVNKLLYPELEYIYFRSDREAISSSMVRELHMYGADVEALVPRAVLELMRKCDNK